MSQFFYSVREPLQPKAGDTEIKWETYIHSFNTDCIIRSTEYEKGKVAILLNDGHEEAQDHPVKKDNGKTEMKRERVWLVSQIYLNAADTTRFRQEMGCTLTEDAPTDRPEPM